MGQIAASISIEGQPAPDLFASLVEMEVEDDRTVASVFRIKLGISRQDQGVWLLLDDDRIKPWAKVTINATVGDEEQDLITGYITNIRTHFDIEETESYLELVGMDPSSLMGVEEKIKQWPNKSDSDIATEIFSDYGLTPQVDGTGVVHDENAYTILQRETDIQFLRKLARRNGYECVVKGTQGFFGKPVLTGDPLPVLSAHFGGETNLTSFNVHWEAQRPVAVEMHQIDAVEKQILDATASPGTQKQLGKNGPLAVTIPNGATAKTIVKHAMTTSVAEMTNLVQGVNDEAEWFIEGHGEVDTVIYGAALEAGKLVGIKGVGEAFSGIYYITHVKHKFDLERYMQHFTARRNGSAPSGPSDFGSGNSLF
jgi:hypothetical protein